MKIYFLFLFIFGFLSCANNNEKLKTINPVIVKTDTTPKPFTHFKIWVDTNFRKLNCGLYINKQGELGYQDFDKPGCDTCWCGNVYIVKAYVRLKKHKILPEAKSDDYYTFIPLKKIIDTASLRFLNGLYFKDKNRVFYFHNMQERGIISEVEGADANTFKAFRDTLCRYGFDKDFFYEGDERISKEVVKKLGLKRI